MIHLNILCLYGTVEDDFTIGFQQNRPKAENALQMK